jgi:hypothetical protein
LMVACPRVPLELRTACLKVINAREHAYRRQMCIVEEAK